MMWLLLWSCQEIDPELVLIKEQARDGQWEQVEQRYIAHIQQNPDPDLYLALSKIFDGQEQPELAHVMRMRAQSMSSIDLWSAGVLIFIGLGLYAHNRTRWSWIFVASALIVLAFYEDVRYKGTVLSVQTNVFHTRSNRGIPLFSLEKGSTVGIIEEDSGYFLIEYEKNRGWVEQKKVLSWNPAHSLQIEE